MTEINADDWEGVEDSKVRDFVLASMPRAGRAGDWQSQELLFDMTCTMADAAVRAETLSKLLVMPEHELHQQIAWEIQQSGYAYSLPYIRQLLESDLSMLAYTSSEPAVIAKWFSHALASIGTPEAVQMIEEFANSGKPGIAEEMKYRLNKLGKSRR